MTCRRCHKGDCPGCPERRDCADCGYRFDVDHLDDRGRCDECAGERVAHANAMSADLSRPHALAAALDRRGALLDGRAAQAIRELATALDQLTIAQADTARAVATATTERCAEVAEQIARLYREAGRRSTLDREVNVVREVVAERIAREIRALGNVRATSTLADTLPAPAR